MGKQTVSDFPVDTNGHCFICMNKVLPKHDSVALESSVPSSHVSVNALSQYLKMDMRKVFHEQESIPSDLLDNVKRSKLKVSLCDKCSKWNERISILCRQLEKIETEVSFYLELVQGSLLRSNEDVKTGLLYKMDGNYLEGGSLEKVRIVKALRTEAMQKCLDKLRTGQPRVNIQNLTANQVFSKRSRIKAKFLKTKGSDVEVINYNYGENDDEPMEGTLSDDEDESKNAGVGEGHNHYPNFEGNPSTFQTNPAAPTSQRRNMSNVTVMKSSVKVSVPTSSAEEVQGLTYVINPETGKFKCNICSVELRHKGNLKVHYDSVHLKIKHKCNICGKEFSKKCNYTAHHRSAHVGVRFKCNLCGKCLKSKYGLIIHQQSAHLGKRGG